MHPAITLLLGLPDGERRVGPFVLLRQLGRGGFAPVWLAREEYGGVELRSVALKLFALQPSRGALLGRQSRIVVEEARALCQVEHPNVVRFYSIALEESRGVLGLAMEYLSGRPLDGTLADSGPVAVAEAIEVAIAMTSALAAVHAQGVVHRDVKPGNIVKTATGYKLIDFGLASQNATAQPDRAQEAEDIPIATRSCRSALVRATRTLAERPELVTLCGTVGYIDPECIARSAAASPASDLYALGASLFELLTGKVPAEVDGLLLGQIIDGRRRPPAVRSLRADVPAALGQLIDGLLQPRPDLRPPSAEWVAARLRSIPDSSPPSPSGAPPKARHFPVANADFAGLNEGTAATWATVAAPSLARLAPVRQYGFPEPPLPNGRQALPRK